MKLVWLLVLGIFVLAGCTGGSDTSSKAPQRNTPAAGGGTGAAPAGTGQNNTNSYGAGTGPGTAGQGVASSPSGTDAARP